jgi:hypothetical protein
MKYANAKLGFSFELPDGWKEQPSVIPPTFISDTGVIQVKAAIILPNFRTPTLRKTFIGEPGCEFVEGAYCGDETENVLLMHDTRRHEGWLSAVRDGIHYEVTWDPR